MAGPDGQFWEQRFAEDNTPWDRGEASPQLHAWLATGALKPCRILVPGCGSGYEVAELARRGFHVTGLDYAASALARARAAEGRIEGPPYHCDINAMRALFPGPSWSWPKPPYPRATHPAGLVELAVILARAIGPDASDSRLAAR